MKKKIKIVSPPHERPKGQTIKNAPTSDQEFFDVVESADWPTLKQFGFRKWYTMNNVISENIGRKDDPKMISIPVFTPKSTEEAANLISGVINDEIVKADGSILIDLSTEEPVPLSFLEEDEDIILFPGEWYDLIPDGFKCTSLNGKSYTFRKGISNNDTRFGCLAYGLRRKCQKETQ